MLRWSAAALCAAVNVKLPWRAEPPAHHHVDGVGTGARAPVPDASSLAAMSEERVQDLHCDEQQGSPTTRHQSTQTRESKTLPKHAGRLRLKTREKLLSHEQHWAAPPFWLDGTETPVE